MKKTFCFSALILLLFFSLFFFAGCNNSSSEKFDIDASVIGICEKHGMTNGMIFRSSSDVLGEYLDDNLIVSLYGDASESPDFSNIESYCVYIDDTDYKVLTDVGIFKLKDVSYADIFAAYLQARIDEMILKAGNYPDIDVETLKKAVIKKTGGYIYYTVGYDSAAIASELADLFR